MNDEARPPLEEGGGRIFTWPPSVLSILAECAGWPRVEYGILSIEGEASWRDALRRASTAEHPRLLALLGAPWASSELLATEPARGRLHRWYSRGRPVATPENVTISGDDALFPLVRRALGRLPAPVLDHVRRNAIVLAVGRTCVGFCVTLPAAAVDATEGRRLLVCGYFAEGDTEQAFESIVGHEVAHHYLIAAPEADLQPRSEAEAAEAAEDRNRLLSCATEWNLLPELYTPRERDEREACALAASWGFPQSGEACARNARRALLAEAAAAPRLPEFEP